MMRKRARDSVFFRLFMAALLVLIPMNLLLMLYAVFLFNNVRASARTEQKNVMEMYMSSLDTVADKMTSSFYRIISDEDMLRLMQSDAGKSPDNVEWYAARTRVMDRYTQWLQDYPLLDGVFSYYDYRGKGENTWAICSQNPNPVMYINDHIIGLLEERLETAKRMGEDYRGCPWEYCSIEDGDYLIRIWRRNNCYYGCWFNLDCVLERFYGNSGEAGQMFFMDQEGNICTSGYTGSARGKKQDVYVPSKSTGIVLVLPEDSRAVIYSMPKIVLIFLLLAVLALTALPLLVFVTRRYILKPMNHLLDAMEELRKGNLDYQIPRTKITGEFAVLEESFNLMTRQLHDTKIAAYEGSWNASASRCAI